MTEKEFDRLRELEQKPMLDEREFAQYEFLKKQASQQERVKMFHKNQKAPYEEKVSRAYNLAWEFYKAVGGKAYVAVGGLDSITLYLFLRSIGIDVPAVSASVLEDKSIQRVHKALGVITLKPLRSKVEVIREFGWPILSKEIAGKISLLQRPSEKNATVRHAIITGETGAQGGYRSGTRMQMPKRWLELFGGADQEGGNLGYKAADFLVSDKCCYYLKEKPCDNYHKETGRWPYMGLMASEGGRRQKALASNGCNYISEKTKRSAPFATFNRQDLLTLALEMDAWYREHADLFPGIDGQPLETVIPEIYGEIVRNADGTLKTTKAQRTGCSMCGFGVHMEKRPHRFDQLWQRNPKEWELWMSHVVQDENGEWYGWDKALDYIGVEWREPWKIFEPDDQKCLFDLAESESVRL